MSEPLKETEPEPAMEPVHEFVGEISPEEAFYAKRMQYNYVCSSESDKYHEPTCRWTDKIKDENLVHFDTVEEAQAAGYDACGTCKPK